MVLDSVFCPSLFMIGKVTNDLGGGTECPQQAGVAILPVDRLVAFCEEVTSTV